MLEQGYLGLNRALLHSLEPSPKYLTPATQRMPPHLEGRATLYANHHKELAW
jgi:hypothetical protein